MLHDKLWAVASRLLPVFRPATNPTCRAQKNENNAIMAQCKPAPNSFTRGVSQISRGVVAATPDGSVTSAARGRFSANENYRGEK
jgi:hypothetical protein